MLQFHGQISVLVNHYSLARFFLSYRGLRQADIANRLRFFIMEVLRVEVGMGVEPGYVEDPKFGVPEGACI